MAELKCIAINPTRPHLIAIGANDCYARLYDRRYGLKDVHTLLLALNCLLFFERMVNLVNYPTSQSLETNKWLPVDSQSPDCVQYYAPGHLAKDKCGEYINKLSATYVVFNSSGSELLVNMGGEHIYLFDIDNPRPTSTLCVPDSSIKKLYGTANTGLKVNFSIVFFFKHNIFIVYLFLYVYSV